MAPKNSRMRQTGQRALRKGRISFPGRIYLLTITTANRNPLFTDYPRARLACRCINDAGCWPDSRLLCWALMPNHRRGLLELSETATLSEIANRWKAITGRELHRQGYIGPVRQRGFHDHALRREEGVLEASRYIAANPAQKARPVARGQAPTRRSLRTKPK